jgi:hypothetical protein
LEHADHKVQTIKQRQLALTLEFENAAHFAASLKSPTPLGSLPGLFSDAAIRSARSGRNYKSNSNLLARIFPPVGVEHSFDASSVCSTGPVEQTIATAYLIKHRQVFAVIL